MKLRLLALGTLALAIVLLVGTALAQTSPSYDLSWHVVASGGREGMAAGSYQVHGTLGQFAIGPGQETSYNLCTGYWCGITWGSDLYLPLIYKVAEP